MKDFSFNIDLQSCIRALLKYWQVILLAALLGGFSGWSLSQWVFMPVYESSITILACDAADRDKVQQSMVQTIELSNRLVNDYKELISSRKVQNEVARLKKQRFPEEQQKNFSVNSDLQRNTRMIKITATSSSPAVAAFAANTTGEVFIKVVWEIMRLKSIQVLDAAVLPLTPKSPKPLVNTMLGFVLGLGLALLAALTRELLDWTIKIPEEIPERLGKNVIGTIPEANAGEEKSRPGMTIRARRFFGEEKNNHAVAEAFKILRTNVEFIMPGGRKSKIIMFTSALPGEGKSTVIANLALSMSESGRKVIILDCDLRKPFMHKFFSLNNSSGLVSIIAGAVPFQDVIHRDVLGKGLDIISSGPIPPNPTELLMTDGFKQLLTELAESYDYILLDAPPTLNMADTAIAGRLSDASIFIVTAGKTRIGLIKCCIRQLNQSGIEVSGILLNRFNAEAVKYSYYYYHYHYHEHDAGHEPLNSIPERELT